MTRTGILIGNIFDWVKKVTHFERSAPCNFFFFIITIHFLGINCAIKTPKSPGRVTFEKTFSKEQFQSCPQKKKMQTII